MSEYQSGTLRKNPSGRWVIDSHWEITSGDVIEVKIGEHWIETRVEHDGFDYYPVVLGVELYDGMPARIKF